MRVGVLDGMLMFGLIGGLLSRYGVAGYST